MPAGDAIDGISALLAAQSSGSTPTAHQFSPPMRPGLGSSSHSSCAGETGPEPADRSAHAQGLGPRLLSRSQTASSESEYPDREHPTAHETAPVPPAWLHDDGDSDFDSDGCGPEFQPTRTDETGFPRWNWGASYPVGPPASSAADTTAAGLGCAADSDATAAAQGVGAPLNAGQLVDWLLAESALADRSRAGRL
jgi:hypothetical protein